MLHVRVPGVHLSPVAQAAASASTAVAGEAPVPVAGRGFVVGIIETDDDTTEGIMGSWTLRPQRSTFRGGNPSAVNRAKRMVKRHARELHGAGVQEAVRDLTALLPTLPDGLEWAYETTPQGQETAHGLTVVGWRCTKGLVFCPDHRGCGNVPVTSGDLNTAPGSPFECFDCGKDLRS